MVYKVRFRIDKKNIKLGVQLFESALAFAFDDNDLPLDGFYKFQNKVIQEMREHSLIRYQFPEYWHEGMIYLRFEVPYSDELNSEFEKRFLDFLDIHGYRDSEIDICYVDIEEENPEWSVSHNFVEIESPYF